MLTGKLHMNDDGNDHTHPHCASLSKRLRMPNRRRSYRNTPYDSTQASGLEDVRFRTRIWLWMVASCFEPEQYEDFQKDQNDGITKQCNDLQSMLPIQFRFLTFRRRGEMCPNMMRWMNDWTNVNMLNANIMHRHQAPNRREPNLIVTRNENEILTTIELALDENMTKKETPNSLIYCWKMA